MKLHSIDGALLTEQMLETIAEAPAEDEAKLGLGHCSVLVLQLSVALAGCGIVHWMMT